MSSRLSIRDILTTVTLAPEIEHPSNPDQPCNCAKCRDDLLCFGGFLVDKEGDAFFPRVSPDNSTKIIGVAPKTWLSMLAKESPSSKPHYIDFISRMQIRAFDKDYSKCVAIDFDAGKPKTAKRKSKDDDATPKKKANTTMTAKDVMPQPMNAAAVAQASADAVARAREDETRGVVGETIDLSDDEVQENVEGQGNEDEDLE